MPGLRPGPLRLRGPMQVRLPNHTFICMKSGSHQFRLDPARPGASLRLDVVDPAGKTTTKAR